PPHRPPPALSALSLHDALPIYHRVRAAAEDLDRQDPEVRAPRPSAVALNGTGGGGAQPEAAGRRYKWRFRSSLRHPPPGDPENARDRDAPRAHALRGAHDRL